MEWLEIGDRVPILGVSQSDPGDLSEGKNIFLNPFNYFHR